MGFRHGALAWMAGLALFAGASFAAEAKVDLKVVKYDGLKNIIKQNKGKVVVVDFWSDT